MSDFLIYALTFRLAIIAVGLSTIYMGYRLFVMGVMPNEGSDIEARKCDIQLTIKNAAPGTFFVFFGISVICIMLIQGNPEYNISLKDGNPTLSMRGNDATINSDTTVQTTELNEEQIQEIDSLIQKLLHNNLIKKEAAEPLLNIANIYYNQKWYDNAMTLTNLIIALNLANLDEANQLQEKIIEARKY